MKERKRDRDREKERKTKGKNDREDRKMMQIVTANMFFSTAIKTQFFQKSYLIINCFGSFDFCYTVFLM